MSLDGKRILVTGGTGRLGRALVPRLLDAGAWVAVTFRSNEELAALLSELDPDGPQPHAVSCDLADADSVARLAEDLAQTEALPLQGLACLAGGYTGGKPLWEAPEEEMHANVRENVLPTWRVLRRFVGGMVEAGYGRILTVGARHALDGAPNGAAYAAAKGAVISLTRAMAEDLRGTGVTAVCLAPYKMRDSASDGVASYEEVSAAAAWLLDDEAGVLDADTVRVYGRR